MFLAQRLFIFKNVFICHGIMFISLVQSNICTARALGEEEKRQYLI